MSLAGSMYLTCLFSKQLDYVLNEMIIFRKLQRGTGLQYANYNQLYVPLGQIQS